MVDKEIYSSLSRTDCIPLHGRSAGSTKENHRACYDDTHIACIWQRNVYGLLRRLPCKGWQGRRSRGQCAKNSARADLTLLAKTVEENSHL
jgi:hypothetical protein